MLGSASAPDSNSILLRDTGNASLNLINLLGIFLFVLITNVISEY